MLEDLNEQYPHQPQVLGPLTEAYLQLGEPLHILAAAEAWHAADARAPDALHALIRVYAALDYLALTWRTCQQLLTRFPDDPRAESVRQLERAAADDLQHPAPGLTAEALAFLGDDEGFGGAGWLRPGPLRPARCRGRRLASRARG